VVFACFATYPWGMARATTDRLNAAQPTEGERQVVERFASRLGNELGSDLRALWLYGSAPVAALTQSLTSTCS
jgi:hypothetical protein